MHEQRTCPYCGEPFSPKRSNQKYCCPAHAQAAGNRRRYDGDPAARTSAMTPDEAAKAADAKFELQRADIARDRAAITAARADLKKLLEETDRVKEITSVLKQLVQRIEPIPFRGDPPRTDLPKHEWVLVCSDWHIGQLTTLAETGGLFAQSTEIALEQVQTLWDVTSLVHDIESAGRSIRKLHLLFLGDGLDGDLMRVSQTRKVDHVVAEQYPILYALVEALVAAALTRFDEVEVHIVGGNHDRFGKYGDAGLGELAYIENWSYIMGTHLETAFAANPRVSIRNHQSFFGTTIVAGWKFAFSHGSDVNWRSNSYAGIPYYSLNVAAERMKSMVDGYDFLVMGHGHVPMMLPVGYDSHCIMNGSLPGTSTYVQSKYKSIRRPSQVLLSVHHRIGLTGYHRMYLDHQGLREAVEMWASSPAPTAKKYDLLKGETA